MSVEIRAKIICDSCGASVDGKVQTSTSRGMETYWDAKTKAKSEHWMFSLRYGSTVHLCQQCADTGKPLPNMPVKRRMSYRYLVQQGDGRMLCMGMRSVGASHDFSKDAEELSEYFSSKTQGDEWKGGVYVELLRGWKSKIVLASAGNKLDSE